MYDKLVNGLRKAHEYAMEYGRNPFRYSAYYAKAADAIEELQKQLQKSEVDNINLTGWLAEEHAKHLWIPVTERLPEERTDVLAMTENCDIYVCDFIPSVRQFWTIPGDDLHITDISHWMPLPEPPEEGE